MSNLLREACRWLSAWKQGNISESAVFKVEGGDLQIQVTPVRVRNDEANRLTGTVIGFLVQTQSVPANLKRNTVIEWNDKRFRVVIDKAAEKAYNDPFNYDTFIKVREDAPE